MAILRTILHKYLLDDVLPAEHVQDWVDWSLDARNHFAVEHDPETGEHRSLLVPIAAAVVDRLQDVSGKMQWMIRTSNGFAADGIRVEETGSVGKLIFTMPSNVTFWQGRFTAKWKVLSQVNAAPTLAPVVLRVAGNSGVVWLHAPADEDLADVNSFAPSYGGTLVVIGIKG